MKKVTFVTTNQLKFEMASQACSEHGIVLEQKTLEIDEIQSEDANDIAIDKAQKAFLQIEGPVLVSDDSWFFHGLNGFPGPYMHSMNRWLREEDFLNLTRPLQNKNVTLMQTVVYKDKTRQKLFSAEIKGHLIDEARGSSPSPNQQITVLDGDNGMTIGEIFERGKYTGRQASRVWLEFAQWYEQTS
jgi:XTP/dITP diphosphohydrolase